MPNATSVLADPGAQFTCFPGTKVQIREEERWTASYHRTGDLRWAMQKSTGQSSKSAQMPGLQVEERK